MATQSATSANPQVLPRPRPTDQGPDVELVVVPDLTAGGVRLPLRLWRAATATLTRRVTAVASRAGVAAMTLTADVSAMVAAVLVVGVPVAEAGLLAAVTAALFLAGRLYRPRLTPSALDQLPRLVGAALVAGAAVVALQVASGHAAGHDVLAAAALFALLVVLARVTTNTAVFRLRRSGVLSERTLIVGAGQVAGQVAEVLLDHPEYGLRPVGLIDGDPLLDDGELPVPHVSYELDLARLVEENRADSLVVAYGSVPESSVVDLIRGCDRLPCEIFVVPRLYELLATTDDVETVWGIPLVRLRRAAFRTAAWRAKRAMDVLFSSLALVLLSPLLLLCALLVRLETGPNVLFRQERIGLDGRPFVLLKFRSLKPLDEAESSQRWNVADDERIGPVGRVLRKTSLDELPQLWNIVRGDMSLVGPRPERPHFVSQFGERYPRYLARHRLPAGLTGWSQIHGLRGDTSIADRARFDNCYIESWSLWLDVKIMLRTVAQVLRFAGR
ncbi:MAG TPA: exopolysaccharide biosynthesis polyprenyl glycosylphosphotransferase [Actinomycetes bacterium]|nr:exopolysaccharide biosynthesis polyprenyl glycosylphosphotransferase [Actinomycetes bacterium]